MRSYESTQSIFDRVKGACYTPHIILYRVYRYRKNEDCRTRIIDTKYIYNIIETTQNRKKMSILTRKRETY